MKIFVGSLLVLILLSSQSLAQTLPVGTPVLEDTWRRMQISGEKDINTSFTVRPVYFNNSDSDFASKYDPYSLILSTQNKFSFANGKGQLRLLPVTLKQQYNTNHPYGWNDGSMIQARGYQNQFSFGAYAKIGHLSIQLQPEIVYAQNKNFPAYAGQQHNDTIWKTYYTTVLNFIDNPEKYGNGSYAKIFPGQSSIRFNFKKLSVGVSTENLWWGPGIRNSLIMSNNAPGFWHATFNSTSPVTSPIGSFEWQAISGILKSSGILPLDTSSTFNNQKLYVPKPNGDRYLNGMIITWEPKWTKGLYLGFSRVYYQYEFTLQHSFEGYLPVLGQLFKKGLPYADQKDEILSLFFRLVLPKEKAEVYAEFGRNDHSLNLRDLIAEPEHSRAYIIGVRKIFETHSKTQFEILSEITNLALDGTKLLREDPTWYTHPKVVDGYTNLGQVIGAGIGPGGSSQTVAFNWINGIKKFGVMFERVVWNNDFYYTAFEPTQNFLNHWVDLSINLNKSWQHKHFLYDANLSFIQSYNYEWDKDARNIHATFSVSYLF